LSCFANLLTIDADGTDPEQAWQAISQAVEHARSGAGPCLLQMRVVRLTGHTFIDDQSYKSSTERLAETERDPLERLRSYIANPDKWGRLVEEVHAELATAQAEAEASPEPDPAQVRSALFYEGQTPKQGGLARKMPTCRQAAITHSQPGRASTSSTQCARHWRRK